MANRRFIDFPIASTVGDNDIVLIWQDGLNKQTTKGTLIQGAPTSLEGLTDVDIAGLINGQILQYNSVTGKWENVDRAALNLSELGDVSIVSPSNGQVLIYNSTTSKWENTSAGFVPYTGAVTTVNLAGQTIQAGSFVKDGGTSAQFLKANGSVDSNTYLTTGSAAATYVPYTGATADVNLGTHDLTAERGTFENNGSSDTLTVNHTSGSGKGINVSKGGNGEALYVEKTSGSGNAMRVLGGRTSLVDLALSSVTNTAGDFLTISGGVVHQRTPTETRSDVGAQAQLNGTGFVKASGTTITYDNSTYQVTSEKGQPNGYASLDSNGKVPLVQINDALIGNVNFQGLWNASTNTPTLANPPASGTKGYYYIVSTAGTFASISFEVGDWIISDGTAWGKVDNTDAVSSVFGRTGNVTAANGDYTTAQVTESGNLYYTDGRARGALSFVAGSGAYNSTTGVITIPTNNNQITNGAGYITSAALSGYLPLTGGTMTGNVNWAQTDRGITWGFNTDGASIKFYNTADGDTNSRLEFATLDNNNEYFRWVHIPDGGSAYESMRLMPISSGNAELIVTGKIIKSGGTSSQYLMADGSVSTLSNVITGTGSAGQVAYWSSGSAITGESNLFWDATNDRLGIGIAIPTNPLHIVSNTLAQLNVEALSGNTNAQINLEPKGTGIAVIGPANSVTLAFRTGPDTRLAIFNDGNVTISNSLSNAGFKLDVNGTARFSGQITMAYTGTPRLIVQDTGSGDGNVGVLFKENTSNKWTIASVSSALQIYNEQTQSNALFITSGNNVGIGTTTISDKLIVNGNLGVTDGSFASGESYSLFLGDKNAFINSTFGQRVRLGAFNGFDFGFAQNSNLSLSSTWMSISGSGNVGIGINPDVKFQVNDGTNINLGIKVGQTNSSAVMLNAFNNGATANIPLEFRATSFNFTVGNVSISPLSGSGNRIVVANSGGTLISAVIGSGLAFDGTTLTATGGGSGSISGSGNSGIIALFTGTTSIGNSIITQSSGNIGINVSNPLANLQVGNGTQSAINGAGNKIHIATNGTRSALLTLANSSGGTTVEGQFESSAESADLRIIVGSSTNHPLVFRTNNTDRLRIMSDGNVLINTSSDNGNRLRVNGTIFSDSSVTATSFFESSDATIKTLVEDDYQAKGIDSVVAKLYIKNGKQELGYYAQDLEGVLPSAVSKGSNGLLNLSYREVHTAKIAYLEQQIKELRNELLKPS
jgi:hypothetical protein